MCRLEGQASEEWFRVKAADVRRALLGPKSTSAFRTQIHCPWLLATVGSFPHALYALHLALVAGTFYQDGGRVFWDVRHPDRVIVVELRDEQSLRLVVEVADPAAEVDGLRRAVAVAHG
jgi:hypothetical protein